MIKKTFLFFVFFTFFGSISSKTIMMNMIRNHSLDDIPFTQYKLDVSKCTGFQHHTGSKIYIPQEALIFKNNKPCNTSITFSYRELRTPSEIIAADITMKYYEGKTRKDLVTAGMFEMYALCEKETLTMKPGKSIQVFFAVENVEPKTNAYRYDYATHVWNYYKSPVADLPAVTNPNDSINQLWGSTPVPSVNDSTQMFDPDGIEFDPESWRRWQHEQNLKMNAFKSLKIDSFGLYNYDYILDKENEIAVVADFRLLNQNTSLQSTVYVVYPQVNSVLYFSPREWETGFTLLPASGIKLFSILENGNIAMLPSAEISVESIKSWKNKSHTFILVENVTPVQNCQQLASVTKIDQLVKK